MIAGRVFAGHFVGALLYRGSRYVLFVAGYHARKVRRWRRVYR